MLKIFLAFFIVLQTSFYSLQFTSTVGSQVNLSNYQGKKVLLVNIATGSDKIGQLVGLQQLQSTLR